MLQLPHSSLISEISLTFQRIVGGSGISELPSSAAVGTAAHAHDATGSALVAVATPDVFRDLPSGLRVESGDSLDLLSAGASMFTSSSEVGKGGASLLTGN